MKENQKSLPRRQAGRINNWNIGSGKYFFAFLIYYSAVRFLLDFLRIDKAMFLSTGLGVNQMVLLGVLVFIGLYLSIKAKRKKPQKSS